jgi:hypothetical protein
MERFHNQTPAGPSSFDSSGHDGHQELRCFHPGQISEFWVSDLTNDLSCFGLCSFGDEADRPDDLSLFSLTSEARPSSGVEAGYHRHDRAM